MARRWSELATAGIAFGIAILITWLADPNRNAPIALVGLLAFPIIAILAGSNTISLWLIRIVASIAYRRGDYVVNLTDQKIHRRPGIGTILREAIVPALILLDFATLIRVTLFDQVAPIVVVPFVGLATILALVVGGFACALVPVIWGFEGARFRRVEPKTRIPDKLPFIQGFTLVAFGLAAWKLTSGVAWGPGLLAVPKELWTASVVALLYYAIGVCLTALFYHGMIEDLVKYTTQVVGARPWAYSREHIQAQEEELRDLKRLQEGDPPQDLSSTLEFTRS